MDALRFTQLVEAGSHARGVGAHGDAAMLLRQALDLWRGDALRDVGPAALIDAEISRLEEIRLRALESWYAVRLDLGEAEDVVSDLQALAAEHPLREGLQESLVLALSLSGRQAEALATYDAVRALLRDELGLDPGPALRELHGRLLRQELAAPVAAARLPRLAVPVTTTIGRERELHEVEALLADRTHRLITLIGPGGSGKTRLATVAAARAGASYSGGVGMVALEAVRDPVVALGTIASALGVRATGVETVSAMARELARRELLVVLDNLEQVVAVGPALVDLLAQAPGLTLLVTSRVVLNVAGEHVFPVPPLALPAAPGRAGAAQSAAVVLFSERARAARSSFALTDANAADVAELCRRLDGLPLAIELAAGQSRVLSPAQLLQRLSSRLDTVEPTQRDRPVRHQSLRSAVDGSYELLSPEGRELLARLSVFAGGFDLAAAEAVCDAGVGALAELVDHSLVQVADVPERRFRLLETVREYAAERRAQSVGSAAGALHAAYYLSLAQGLNLDAGLPSAAPVRMDVAILEQDNIRAALDWCASSGSVALGLELATALEYLWVAKNPREGVRWFRLLLEHPDAAGVDPAILAPALRAYGTSADISGDDERAAALYQQSLELFERLGDDRGRAILLQRLGIQRMRSGELTAARALVESSAELNLRDEDPYVRLYGRVLSTGTLGAIRRDAGDHATAYDLLAQSCELAGEAGIGWWATQTTAELAALSLAAGRIDEADRDAREVLRHPEDAFCSVFAVGVLAGVAAQRGQYERAGLLWGAVETDDAVAALGGWRRSRPECAARIVAAAGPDFDRGHARGRLLSLDEAVAVALEPPAR